jgi:ABC-2 type transport system ATP-binding protein
MSDEDVPNMTQAVVVKGLTKRFGDRTAVDSLDFEVPARSIAGFIGPNGAGKTTTLRTLVGLLKPSSGEGAVLGMPLDHPERYLARVGALVEGPGFYAGLSGERNLHVLAAAAGLDPKPIPELLERVGLAGRGRDPYKTYSLGMKQRLGIAAALLGNPELLILDEPANGLDPRACATCAYCFSRYARKDTRFSCRRICSANSSRSATGSL